MTSRERWTVYPLLFLAIGLAMRAGLPLEEPSDTLAAHAVEAGRVVCREIVVTGTDAIAIGTGPEGRDGRVERFDAEGEPIDDEHARQDSNLQTSAPQTEAGG